MALLNTGVNYARHGNAGEAERVLDEVRADAKFVESLKEDPNFSGYYPVIRARTMRLTGHFHASGYQSLLHHTHYIIRRK
jgi:hypothetical protein